MITEIIIKETVNWEEMGQNWIYGQLSLSVNHSKMVMLETTEGVVSWMLS